MTNPRRASAVAVASLLGATLFWAGNYVVGAAAVNSIDPISLTLLRWLLAVVPLLLIAQFSERPDWRLILRAWPWVLALSATGILGYNLFLYGALQFTDPLSASVINAFNPALIALAAAMFLRHRLTVTSIVGILVALVGVLIVLSRGNPTGLLAGGFGLGELLMVGAIMVWTAYTVLGRRAPKLPVISLTAAQAVGAVVILTPISLAFGGPTIPTESATIWAVVYIAVFPSVLSYLLWNRALTVIPPARAGVFLNLITVFTAILTLLLGQPITWPQIIGGVVVLAGVTIANAYAFRSSVRA